jgi:nitrate reductase gamma subunit
MKIVLGSILFVAGVAILGMLIAAWLWASHQYSVGVTTRFFEEALFGMIVGVACVISGSWLMLRSRVGR